MSNNSIDPIANNALKSLIDNIPVNSPAVKNLVADLIAEANQPQYTAKEIDELESAPTVGIEFVYFARSGDREKGIEGKEWTIDFDRTTSVCFEWRNIHYLVIQGPYTPVCFNLNRAYFIGENEPIMDGLKKDRVFLHMDPSKFPSENQQQDLLNVAGNGNPHSGV
jgi:hypothetical protein